MDPSNTIIIIESPNKIKKIREITGCRVLATVGHFKDIPSDSIGFDLKTYEPVFKISKGKERVAKELKGLKDKTIIIASDPDREGYAIGTHVHEAVKKSCKNVLRAEIHEITPKGVDAALRAAVSFPQTNKGLYDAFLGRRVGDRLIGYMLSPLASNALQAVFSVGRVQSPALRLVCDREADIRIFQRTPYYQVELTLMAAGIEFWAYHQTGNITDKATADEIMKRIEGSGPVAIVLEVNGKETKKGPKPPFTTSTLQQAASNRLSFGAEQTMELAQQLFERGLITYHRTDSVRISPEFIAEIRGQISRELGPEFCSDAPLSHASKNSQAEAHEGIRPTHVHALVDLGKITGENGLNDDLAALYRLIFCRTIASQMSQAVYRSTVVHLSYGGETFNASGSVLEFPGFSKIYEDAEKPAEEQNEKLPSLNKGQSVDVKGRNLLEKSTKAPSRYTEATLVKELEKRGIGRPSTYASIMKTLKERKYLVIQKRFLIPTEDGERLIRLLKDKYQWVVDYDFTRAMEDTLDLVEQKKTKWQDFVRKLHERLGFISPPMWNVRK